MRRAIAAGVIGGLILGGTAAIPALAAASAPAVAGGAATSGPAATAGPATKTVIYAGYAFQVPASWPVYRLDEHPQTCVRYDVHAVYLGTPGANMDCPAGLVGRTQTVSFIPAGNPVPGKNAGPGKGAGTARPARQSAAARIEPQRLPAVHRAISRNAVRHELEVSLGPAGAGGTVLATYGAAPGVIDQVLNTLRLAPAGAAQTTTQAGTQTTTQVMHPAVVPERAAGAPKTYTSWRGVPAGWPTQIVQPPQPPQPAWHPVGGFDACTAPSLATMRVWRRAYAAVGTYIGGVNAACAYGNLSASWIRNVSAGGWGVLPTYVGPQAPCWDGGNGVRINPRKAAAQGNAAGQDAVADARYFGLAPGSPIYYDMEAYIGGTTCKLAILRFLSAWDRSVAARGYLPAVYSSRDSGIANIERWTAGHHPGFTPPDALWIALWDGIASLNGDRLAWPLTERSKQYSGNATVRVGGIRLNIDKDIVGGPLAR